MRYFTVTLQEGSLLQDASFEGLREQLYKAPDGGAFAERVSFRVNDDLTIEQIELRPYRVQFNQAEEFFWSLEAALEKAIDEYNWGSFPNVRVYKDGRRVCRFFD